ncbi:unnamed protein product [Protopolystoma xenopodis]|uniref:Uncharacterized protein n=1 Tax=Protopolystoma xenopodis TaxID=117903 RepID=A0A3S5BMS2_9PLAT|nr:unnamed protein product [Protopolystoma xenopodis]
MATWDSRSSRRPPDNRVHELYTESKEEANAEGQHKLNPTDDESIFLAEAISAHPTPGSSLCLPVYLLSECPFVARPAGPTAQRSLSTGSETSGSNFCSWVHMTEAGR